MNLYNEPVNVGLREKNSQKLAAVYPEKISGNPAEVKRTVFDWYYKRSCEAERELENLYVDIVSEKEFESFQ